MNRLADIVCTWNRSALLATTLASGSGVGTLGGTAVKVLVVDNNSGDDMRAPLEASRTDWPMDRLHLLSPASAGPAWRALSESRQNMAPDLDRQFHPLTPAQGLGPHREARNHLNRQLRRHQAPGLALRPSFMPSSGQ